MGIGTGILRDLKARKPWYVSDWTEGFKSGYRIMAPSVYIFFASLIPGLAFGEQIDHETDGKFNGVHVLASTAICGVITTFIGGQPLLIVGVAEPAVLVYAFMYQFAKSQNFEDNFVPWCTWVLIFTAILLFILAFSGACEFINLFTRFAAELFGMLIAILFLQQAIKGLVQEFNITSQSCVDETAASCVPYTSAEKIVNGLWAVILCSGVLLTSMLTRTARSWPFLKAGLRSFIADYGVPVMILMWTGISYALQESTPEGIPRRLSMPNTWNTGGKNSNWVVVRAMTDVTGTQIGYAVVPAMIIALLFFFDENVSALLAQQKDFQLIRPTAYNYDMFLLGLMTLVCGLLGLPPVNVVLPQAPMHTKSLMTLRTMLNTRDAKRAASNPATSKPPSIATGLNDLPANTKTSSPSGLNDLDTSSAGQNVSATPELLSGVVPIHVTEQRLSNLIQSLMVAGAIAATPAVRLIPKSVLWGYFAFMAVESLPGSEFFDRLKLLFTDKSKRVDMLNRVHPVYLETVTFKNIVKFTLFQVGFLCFVYAITWAGVAGIAFPVPIMALIPLRQYFMPKLFDAWTLSQLDAADYEDAPPAPASVVRELQKRSSIGLDRASVDRSILEQEQAGYRAVKHHITASEMLHRTSMARASIELRSGDISEFVAGSGAQPRSRELA